MAAVSPKRVPTTSVVFLFFLSIYVFGMSGWIQYGDEIEKYRVAQSLVERRELSFRPTEMRNEIGVGGRTYSIYEMGQTLWQVPFYVVGKFAYGFFPQPDSNTVTLLFVGLLDPIVSALTCALVFKTGQSLGFRYRTSLVLALVYGLGTIAWPYSKGFTREPLLTLLLLSSLHTARLYRTSGKSRWVLASGLLAGYLAYTKLIQAMVIPFLAVYLAFAARDQVDTRGLRTGRVAGKVAKILGIFFSPFLLFLGLQSLYAFFRFGTLYAGIAGTKSNPLEWIALLISVSQPIQALGGLLLSPEKSLFVYSPPVLLALVGFPFWLSTRSREGWLFAGAIAIEFASVLLRPDWGGGSWWGPRYLVQITPLLILSLGAWLESSGRITRKMRALALGALSGVGAMVQLVGVSSSDRDYLDATGQGISLLGQIDFLRHGAFEALFVHLSPYGGLVRIEPFGLLLIAIALSLGLYLLRAILHRGLSEVTSGRLGLGLASAVIALEFAGFLAWVVAPYSTVLAAKADDKYIAGRAFFEKGRICDASAMFLMALERGTRFQSETRDYLLGLLPHARGPVIPVDRLADKVDSSPDATVEKDDRVTISGSPSLRLGSTSDRDATATATSQPFEVSPNSTYELFGWMRTERVYGTGYAAITVFEDDGSWRGGRDTDAKLMDETRGWQPFRKIITTLPTSRRVFVKTSLWNSFGTVWVDGVELNQVSGPVPVAWGGGHTLCPVQRFK